MNWIALVAGLCVLAVTTADFVYTTISAHGVGPLTKLTAGGAFRAWKAITPRHPGERTQLLTGPLCMCAVALGWMIGTALGWYLVFNFQNGALLVDDSAANWTHTLAFIGHSISTAGSANAKTGGPVWDMVGALAAVSGMIVLTLSVSFILNVMNTVANGRAFATLVHSADPGQRDNVSLFLPSLAQLVSSIKAVPVALCYTAGKPDQRTTDALVHFVRRIDHDETVLRHYRPALSGIPYAGIDLDDDYATIHGKLIDWAETYKIGSDEGGSQSDQPDRSRRASDPEPDGGESQKREETDDVRHGRHEHA